MYIRYDSEGRITACSPIEGVLSGENTLAIAGGKVPDDLLETFAFGKYMVREGRITENRSWQPPEITPAEVPAVLPDPPAPDKAPVAPEGGKKSKKGKSPG